MRYYYTDVKHLVSPAVPQPGVFRVAPKVGRKTQRTLAALRKQKKILQSETTPPARAEYFVVETDDLMRAVRKQVQFMNEVGRHRSTELVVLMGEDLWWEAVASLPHAYAAFDHQERFMKNGEFVGYGLRFVFVPRLPGFQVLPLNLFSR